MFARDWLIAKTQFKENVRTTDPDHEIVNEAWAPLHSGDKWHRETYDGHRQMRAHRFNRFGLIPCQNGINDRELLISGYNIANPGLGNISRNMTIEYQRYFVLKADHQPQS